MTTTTLTDTTAVWRFPRARARRQSSDVETVPIGAATRYVMPRATKALREQRIDAVSDLLIASGRRRNILAWIEQHGWGITQRQADNYISLATERLGGLAHTDKTFELGRTVARLQLLFGKALAGRRSATCPAVPACPGPAARPKRGQRARALRPARPARRP